MHHMYEWHFWGMHLFWWIFWVLLLIWVFATRGLSGRRTKKETPLDILKKRFASGDITKEEYEEKKQILKQN